MQYTKLNPIRTGFSYFSTIDYCSCFQLQQPKLNFYTNKNRSKQTCEFCGRSFSTKLQLNRHSKIHDEQNHVTCSECGKTFNSKGNLKIHLQHCLKEGKFKCDFCPMKFHYKNALKTHLVREHNQEREFECSICRTQFMHKKNYTRTMDLPDGRLHLVDF